MMPKKRPPVFGKDHAQTDIPPDFAVLKRRRML
jgi:hypothetical protein